MRYFLSLVLLLSSLGIRAEEGVAWAQQLPSRIESLLADSLFLYSNVGLMVYDLDADSTLFAHNERQMLRPASTMKLLTAIAALDALGTDYEFKTGVYLRGTIKEKTLHGDIVLRGGMDPTLTEADLDDVADAILSLGIDSITGGIAEDSSICDDAKWGEGWCWDDENPLLAPLLLCDTTTDRQRSFSAALISRLQQQGIGIGCLKPESDQRVSLYEKRLFELRTPITVIMQRMMKQSDNLYAESLLYQLADRQSTLSRAQSAAQVLRGVIAKAGADSNRCRLADGSGLSLYNYLSAELEVRLLRYAYQRPEIFAALFPTLPIGGLDGTLRNRLKDCPARIFAKTGTVTGVSALAGYAEAPNGHLLAFAIINQGTLSSAPARDFQDRVCRTLISE